VVRFINKVLLEAIRKGASDIHFEPYEKIYRVRCRIDGILQEVHRPPLDLAARLTARLKVMSRMDISEKRVPQDGRIKLKISAKRSIDFRVNSLPTLWGEKIVLRILDPTSAQMGVEALGFEPEQKTLYLGTLEQPQGMILVTGPTGSGKTVTLYTGLNILNTPERNISTAEDPVEINLEGINQVHVNTKVGLTFAEALRSFLRQDPDVVMVGEIRDLETAEIAIKAAQTGHMVLSTLHTNSAPETLTRLRNMGVPAFNIATSVSLIIAQRLARRLCEHCKVPVHPPEAALLELGFSQETLPQLQLFDANLEGCSRCNRGYKGRVGIYEMLRMSSEVAECIMDNGTSIDILKVARQQGFKTLREAGLNKAASGVTSLEEVNRVIKT
jgi:type IV pilus assembly protein PilB